MTSETIVRTGKLVGSLNAIIKPDEPFIAISAHFSLFLAIKIANVFFFQEWHPIVHYRIFCGTSLNFISSSRDESGSCDNRLYLSKLCTMLAWLLDTSPSPFWDTNKWLLRFQVQVQILWQGRLSSNLMDDQPKRHWVEMKVIKVLFRGL